MVDGTLDTKAREFEFLIEEAVRTMKIGETRCINPISQYGIGEKIKSRLLSENAAMQLSLELIPSEDKQEIMKKILKEGDGSECPNEGAVVKLKLHGRLMDGTVFVNKGYNVGEEFEFKTDEGIVIDGLDKAVMEMKKGEIAYLTIPPEYAFGSAESQQELSAVPPNSTVYYKVELVSFQKEKVSCNMTAKEKIEISTKIRKHGEILVEEGRYAKALKKYEKALKLLEGDCFLPEDARAVRDERVSCLFAVLIAKQALEDHHATMALKEGSL